MNNSLERSWETPYPKPISQKSIRSWVKSLPTPFFVYDLETIKRRAKEILDFPRPSFSQFTARYALKANPNRALVEILDRMGVHFDASSEYEVERLIQNGVKPLKIMLSSQQIPVATQRFKEYFTRGLQYNATSLKQLEWYGKLCPGKGVSLRINPGFGSGRDEKTIVGGIDSGFGIWFTYQDPIQRLLKKYRLMVGRIHTHVGAGSDPDTWNMVAESSLRLLRFFPNAHTLNIGGGFKVARHRKDRSARLDYIGEAIKKQMDDFFSRENRSLNLEIEPGTYFVAEAGLLIAKIEDIVSMGSKQKNWFIKLNTGMNDFIRPSLYQSKHQIDIVSQSSRRTKSTSRRYQVIGHCCESGDLISQSHLQDQEIARKKIFNDYTEQYSNPRIGDPVVIHGTGAYGSAMASRYNSFPFISEYLYDGKELILIRKPETIEDILKKEISVSRNSNIMNCL